MIKIGNHISALFSFSKIPSLLIIIFLFLSSANIKAQNNGVKSTGDILLFTLPATALGTTLILGDDEGSLQFAEGFLLNQALTIGLKYVTDKKRPFNNGERAFPSGHTSTTFQSASFIQRRYGWRYGVPAYLLAGFTGYSRINAQKHDGWDVLAGALIGVGSTYIFTTPYQKEHMELTFSGDEDYYCLGFVYKF